MALVLSSVPATRQCSRVQGSGSSLEEAQSTGLWKQPGGGSEYGARSGSSLEEAQRRLMCSRMTEKCGSMRASEPPCVALCCRRENSHCHWQVTI